MPRADSEVSVRIHTTVAYYSATSAITYGTVFLDCTGGYTLGKVTS